MKLNNIKLKEWIDERGFKYGWFAKQLKVSPQRFSVLLNHPEQQPQYPELIAEKAAGLLKIKVEELLIDDENKKGVNDGHPDINQKSDTKS